MTEKEGVLQMQSSGRWAVCRPGQPPVEITSGEQFRVRYRSQCGDAKDRAHLAIAKIEQRLITRRGRFYKPKGMLWRTFHRLCDRYDHHDAVLNAGLLRAVQRLGRRFGPV
jgi:hypothetical protein